MMSLALPAREPFAREVFGPRCHRIADLAPEAAHGKWHGLRSDQPMIEPGRARRRHLLGKVEVRAVGQNQRRLPVVGAPETAHLDDAADRRGMLEGLDASETDMVGAAVRAVDHGIGLPGQFVMQALVHQPADDWGRGRADVDDIVADAAVQPFSVKARCIVLMMSPRMPRSRRLRSASSPTIHSPGPAGAASPIFSRCCSRPIMSRRVSGSLEPRMVRA